MKYTYNLRLMSTAPRQVRDLIAKGHLTPITGPAISGCNTTLRYRLTNPDNLQLKDDFGILVGPHLLQLNLFRLPSWAYQAVVKVHGISQHQVAALLVDEVLSGQASNHREGWLDLLCDTVRQGSQHVSLSPLGTLDASLLKRVRWLSEQTEVYQVDPSREASPWMLILKFDRDERIEWEWGERLGAVGLDVGSNPLIVAAEPDATWQIDGLRRVHLMEGDLDTRLNGRRHIHLAERLHQLTHAVAARTLYEQALRELERASVIYVEDLDMAGMSQGFRRAAYELGLQDFLQAWLPQMAHANGIGLHRVPPAYTSLMCNLCHRQGRRSADGRVFTCGTHGQMDAHENAARVIRQTGSSFTQQRLQNGPRWSRTRYANSL